MVLQCKSGKEELYLLTLPQKFLGDIFVYLNILELCMVGSTCSELNKNSKNPGLWRPMLLSTLRSTSSAPASDVKKAINNHNYIELSPNCLLQLLFLKKIDVQDFTTPMVKLLKAHKEDPISQMLLVLISPEMKQIYKGSNMTALDFAALSIEQIYALFPLRDKFEIFRQADIHPNDFIPLTYLQIKAITRWEGFANMLFVELVFKPQDFAKLSVPQIETIALNFGCKTLFTEWHLHPQDLACFSPEQLETIIRWPNSAKVGRDCGLTPQALGALSPVHLEVLFFTGSLGALKSLPPSPTSLSDDLAIALDAFNIMDTEEGMQLLGINPAL